LSLGFKNHLFMLVLMNKKELTQTIKEIEKDCLKLKREGNLTEFGKGQLELIKIIKKTLRTKNLKEL